VLLRATLREEEGELGRKPRLVRIMVMLVMQVMERKERVRNSWRKSLEWWTGALGW
jgi:hypothetical protein